MAPRPTKMLSRRHAECLLGIRAEARESGCRKMYEDRLEDNRGLPGRAHSLNMGENARRATDKGVKTTVPLRLWVKMTVHQADRIEKEPGCE